MKRILQNGIALAVVIMVLFIVIPLPVQLLDVLLVVNISLSMLILVITMTVSDALDFSIFPSLLLITTLFRLGLNISTTRRILGYNGDAGNVILSFGNMIAQGNIVLGVIIFLIIVLVQMIVVTKGAERVSEVAARFTLDAMPGKQMAIDADLSSGLIDEQGAKARRAKIQKEADFYGAMDGATKFVKGDAILSLIVTAINFVGGLILGVTMGGMELDVALSTYSIATIGDGLVGQIPSLMISTATAMVVTRTVSDGSLNDDMVRQFLGQPRAILTAGLLIALLGVIPGTPHAPLLIVGVGLAVCGWFISTRKEKKEVEEMAAQAAAEAQEEAPQPSAADYYKDVNNVYTLLTVDPIEMEIGYSLIPLVNENSGGKLIGRIVIFRRQYAQEMGFVIPSIRFHDSSALGTNQYVVKIKGEEVARGEILVDYYLALEPANPAGEIDGIETVEPAYGIPSRWILPENKEMAEIYGYTVIDPLSVMQTHLSEVVRSHAYELLGRAEVIQLVENLKRTSPELVEEAIPNFLTYAHLERILRNLLREGVPIRDLGTILETAVDALATTKDLDMVTENIRGALSRTITRRFCEHGQLRVVTLDAEVEKRVISSLSKNEQGIYLAMGPDLMQQIVTQLAELIKKFNDLGQTPIVLTSQVIRVYFARMLSQFYPNLYVLAFNEITSDVQIQSLGNISLRDAGAQRKGGGSMSAGGAAPAFEELGYTQAELDAMSKEDLLLLYRSSGCQELKWPLALRYVGLVKSIALQVRGIYSSFAQVDDIINEGVLALVGAIDKFDPDKGIKFETFVSKRIRGAVIDLARRQDWVPRSVRRKAREIDQASVELYSELGRCPTDDEIAGRLGISNQQYQEDLANSALCNLLSLDSIFDDQEQGGMDVADNAGTGRPEDSLLRQELLDTLAEGISSLRENEQMVVSLYYRKNLSMKEIAQVMEVSEPRISQIHSRAIQKLKLYMKQYMNGDK